MDCAAAFLDEALRNFRGTKRLAEGALARPGRQLTVWDGARIGGLLIRFIARSKRGDKAKVIMLHA